MLEELGVSWAYFFVMRWGPTWTGSLFFPVVFHDSWRSCHRYLANTTDPAAPPSLRKPILHCMFGLQVDVESMILSCSTDWDMDSAFPGGFASRNIDVIHGCFFWPCQQVAWNPPNWLYSLLVSEVCIALAMIPWTRKKAIISPIQNTDMSRACSVNP